VQYSVFECRLTPDQIDRLRARMMKEIEPAEDSVRIYRLCQDCVGKIEILGPGKVTEDPKVYVL
jgi:CRISPR-associated protein Cas2